MSHHEQKHESKEQHYEEQWQRPFLQLPLPPLEYYEELDTKEEEEEKEGRRVIIIDI